MAILSLVSPGPSTMGWKNPHPAMIVPPQSNSENPSQACPQACLLRHPKSYHKKQFLWLISEANLVGFRVTMEATLGNDFQRVPRFG